MTKSRLEAFSDGVLAIIITIMVLELKVPEGYTFASLKPLFPKIISYVVSLSTSGCIGITIIICFRLFRKSMGKYYGGIYTFYFGSP
ncbi:DUF1211 domain-containing protein [Sphingobacterium prati]